MRQPSRGSGPGSFGWENRVKVARSTVKMPDEILNYLNATSPTGGMTRAEAKEILEIEAERKRVQKKIQRRVRR